MTLKTGLLTLLTVAMFAACNGPDTPANGVEPQGTPTPATINYQLVKVHPHDTASFIQGLEFHNGVLYESTGAPDEYGYPSWLGKIDSATGRIQNKIVLDTQYFAEGITIMNGKLYQLTWESKKGFVYDANTLKKLGEFAYNTEGWGLTHDSTSLIMSDGSSNLYFIDPVTFRNLHIVGVTDQDGPVNNLNELEYINGFIYANRWQTPYIVKIDPNSGQVVGRLDLSTLLNEVDNLTPGHDYLNGIAYNPATGTIMVTGKRWPRMYEIKF